jgi:hypothetical protein
MRKNNIIYMFFNINNELLYVGITNDMDMRIAKHRQDKEWFNKINTILISTNILSRNEAHIYEIFYITNKHPKYNIDFINGGNINFSLPDLLFKEYIYNNPRRRMPNKLHVKSNKNNKINIELVNSLFNQGYTIKQIAEKVQRSTQSVKHYLRNLGLIEKQKINRIEDKIIALKKSITILLDENRKYFTIHDIMNKFITVYHCAESTASDIFKDPNIKYSIQEILDKCDLIKVTVNKEIKEKFNIDVPERSYPKIIIKNE